MKKMLFIFIPLLLSCVSQGNMTQPDETYPIEVDIRIYGSDSLLFSGECGNNSDTTKVDSIMVPVGSNNYIGYKSSIEDTSDIVFANFRKEEVEGGLRVSIYVDEHLKKWDATSESYGTIYITWKP